MKCAIVRLKILSTKFSLSENQISFGYVVNITLDFVWSGILVILVLLHVLYRLDCIHYCCFQTGL